MTRLTLCLTLAATASFAQTLRIGVFGLFRPTEAQLSPGRGDTLEVQAGGTVFSLRDGESATISLERDTVECRWSGGAVTSRVVTASSRGGELVLAVPGKLRRRFRGAIEVTAAERALVLVILMDLETAVASVVAAESRPGAPLEALKAQSVASRSFYVAHRRHTRFDFCDTTHCQFLREPPRAQDPGARAALATRGLVLLWRGTPVAALYSASCGGRTRPLAQPEPGDYPYFAVDCPSCTRGSRAGCDYCVRTTGAWANRRGSGAGHGLGLCQAGAAFLASRGSGFRDILEHYYPNAVTALWR